MGGVGKQMGSILADVAVVVARGDDGGKAHGNFTARPVGSFIDDIDTSSLIVTV